eukprot:scaffold13787_cov145-Isochrysis_galbana.AAC.2
MAASTMASAPSTTFAADAIASPEAQRIDSGATRRQKLRIATAQARSGARDDRDAPGEVDPHQRVTSPESTVRRMRRPVHTHVTSQ